MAITNPIAAAWVRALPSERLEFVDEYDFELIKLRHRIANHRLAIASVDSARGIEWDDSWATSVPKLAS